MDFKKILKNEKVLMGGAAIIAFGVTFLILKRMYTAPVQEPVVEQVAETSSADGGCGCGGH